MPPDAAVVAVTLLFIVSTPRTTLADECQTCTLKFHCQADAQDCPDPGDVCRGALNWGRVAPPDLSKGDAVTVAPDAKGGPLLPGDNGKVVAIDLDKKQPYRVRALTGKHAGQVWWYSAIALRVQGSDGDGDGDHPGVCHTGYYSKWGPSFEDKDSTVACQQFAYGASCGQHQSGTFYAHTASNWARVVGILRARAWRTAPLWAGAASATHSPQSPAALARFLAGLHLPP